MRVRKLLIIGAVGLLSLSGLGGVHHLSLANLVWAQTPSPISESVRVTTTVVTNTCPTIPALVSPDNGSYTTNGLVTFTWWRSTALYGISKYRLYLDGTLKFDNIPTSATTNSEYVLTYNSVLERFSLTVKTAIAEGTHTWKITAVDDLACSTDSTTWSFTIDSQNPNFVITNVGEVTTSISAQDISTIPTEPIELEFNEPLLQGTGEASSTVVLTLTIPGDPTQTFTFTIDSGGSWQQQLGILPRDVIMTLDFTITDLAGNVSTLNGVEFFIRQEEIIIPPPSPSPSPSPGPTPTPGVTPSPEPSPTPSPVIIIPLTPPREIVSNIIQEIGERIPEPLKAIVANLPPQVTDALKNLAPVSTALVVVAIPFLATAAVATQFGARFSLEILARILQALGLVPAGKPRGMVFDSETHKGVPFALLTITGIDQPSGTDPQLTQPLIETVVSDVDGVYKGVELPPGKYDIDVRHQDFRFPTAKARPPYLTLRDYYRGEEFEITSEKDDDVLFLIPMDAIERTGKTNWGNRVRVVLAYLSRFTSVLILPLFVLSGILTLLFPSVWNWIVFGIYTLVVVYKSIGWFRVPRLTGVVIDTHGEKLENAIVRLIDTATSELVLVTTSNKHGQFQAFVEPAAYQLSIVKPGFVWTDSPMGSFFEANLMVEPQHVVATMEQVG